MNGQEKDRDVVQQRRENLKNYIAVHSKGPTAFAREIHYSQPSISGLLKTKSFSEKAAETIEQLVHEHLVLKLGKPAIDLCTNRSGRPRKHSVQESAPAPYGVVASDKDEMDLLEAFRSLNPEQRPDVVRDVAMRAIRRNPRASGAVATDGEDTNQRPRKKSSQSPTS